VEGRHGKDAVSPATFEGYEYRADVMRAYAWTKELHELTTPDISAFRSWLLKAFTRDKAQKVLSSFHSVLLEMVAQGVIAVDPAAGVAIKTSRYKKEVAIPSMAEMRAILRAADTLAADDNFWISRAWKRYRPMIYLAADTGMRPQEYLALPLSDVLDNGVRVSQALDRCNNIGPTKTRAGRRFIPVGRDTIGMVRCFIEEREGSNAQQLAFPGTEGRHQQYRRFLRDGWYPLMEKAGLVETKTVKGVNRSVPLYTPYSLRHFYASMLISENTDLKTLQKRMGHEDATLTLNVYGHLIREKETEREAESGGILSRLLAQNSSNEASNGASR
jgi:integrase